VTLLRLRSAQDRLHPRHELPRRERLGDVIVRADLEPDDPVRLLITCSQHHDRHLRACPDVTAHIEAVLAWQTDVEQDEPHLVPVELDQRVVAGADPDDAVPVACQIAADELAD